MKLHIRKWAVGGISAVMLMTAVPFAHAQTVTTTDLQAQISQLLATIASLQAKLAGTQTSAQAIKFTWTRSLAAGSTGEDVRQLQRFLNADPDTRVSLSGAGSPGNETMYYGPATAAAVSKFQVKHRADILSPLGLVSGTGYFGPSTIAKANHIANAVVVLPPVTDDENEDESDSESEDSETAQPQLRGEGILEEVSLQQVGNGRVNEAAGDKPVAEVTIGARHGDIEITRLDISLTANSGNTERDPWDTFENVSLWIDGEKIAEERADDRRAYLNRDSGTLRFSNLDLVIDEDEETEIVIAVSLMRNVSGAGANADWNIAVERLRYFDADGVATDESSFGDLGQSESFSIVERGYGEELKFSRAANDPDPSSIIVDDSRRTTGVTILRYELEAIDADIELDRLFVNVETSAAQYTDVVYRAYLKVDGKLFRADSVLTTGAYSTSSVRLAFDIDGDVEIDEGERVDAELILDFKARTAYQNGESIIARITSAERDLTDAEGSDDINEFSGSVVGSRHTLLSEGIVAPVDSVRFSTDRLGQNATVGVFTLEFDVTAIEGDYYITEFASTSLATTTGGLSYTIDATAGSATSITGTLTSTARENTSGVFTVREGETERFTLTVTVDADTAASYRVGLDSLFFSANTDGLTGGETLDLLPVNKYRTYYQFINN